MIEGCGGKSCSWTRRWEVEKPFTRRGVRLGDGGWTSGSGTGGVVDVGDLFRIDIGG